MCREDWEVYVILSISNMKNVTYSCAESMLSGLSWKHMYEKDLDHSNVIIELWEKVKDM